MPLGQGRIDILMAEQGKEQPPGRQLPVGAAMGFMGGHIRRQRVGFLPVERKVGGIGVAGPERAAQAVPHQIALNLKAAGGGREMFGPRGVLFGTRAGAHTVYAFSGSVIAMDLIGFQE